MRIISGKYRGKRLVAPTNLPARPTTDFAKEALFNILRSRLEFDEIKVLDLFAGTGNLSYEFASRGVPSILCVDNHFGCTKYISQTAKKLEAESIRVYKSDAFKYLEKTHEKYDLIIADPPYALEDKGRLIEIIFKRELLTPDGLFILEHPNQDDFSSHANFEMSRSYSSVNFSIFSPSIQSK